MLTSLRRIIHAVDLHSRRLVRTVQLTAPQLACLRHLDRRGPSNIGAIARGVSLSQATLTGILDRLEARGLVERQRSDVDRRRVQVSLTAAGAAAVATLPVPLDERFAAQLAQLPQRRKEQIRDVLGGFEAMMATTQASDGA